MNAKTHVVIMAGGIGSRFWPMSTVEMPKQFVDILGVGKTMIELTVDRFSGLCPMDNIWVVTGERYVDVVRKLLPQIHDDHILAEPVGRGTAPCIAYASWKIKMIDNQANIVFTPSDAFIVDVTAFSKEVSRALEFTSKKKAIVTIGVRPTRPETGYGYIHLSQQVCDNIYKVAEFREKPVLELAEEYLADGNYLWNAGIFVWNVQTITEEIAHYCPSLANDIEEMSKSFFTEREQETVRELFPKCEKISIDYAVMEKSSCIYTLPVSCGWSDLGTWGSLRQQVLPASENGNKDANAVIGDNIRLYDTKGCIVRTHDLKMVVVQGMEDCIIAEDGGRLLICRLDHEQKITEYTK